MRARWWGASGRQVPALAIEGDPAVPIEEALVVDSPHDPDEIHSAFAAGTPVVVRAEGKSVYFAGDTCVFGDMQLIGRLYKPDLAVLPIGDHYTMGPEEAALALELLGVKRCVPCHWGTFPPLVGRPDKLQELAPDVKVEMIEPGDTVTV